MRILPLVLIPGLLCDARVWKHQTDHLSELTSVSVHPPVEKSLEAILEAILATSPPYFALAGHSMGGWVALELIRRAPKRVKKLCLLNTTAASDDPEKRNKRLELIERSERGEFATVAHQLATLFAEKQPRQRAIEEMFLEAGPTTFLCQQRVMLDRLSCKAVLSTIRCPTLVIHASMDRNFSLQEHREMAEKIPQAALGIVEDSGHMSPLEQPQAVTALIRLWLTCFVKVDSAL